MRNKEPTNKQILDRQLPLHNPNILPTFDTFPCTIDYKDDSIILGLVLKPFGTGDYLSSEQVPEVRFGAQGIIRCELCKSYMSPYNVIIGSGSSYYCALCNWFNTLPVHYTANPDNPELTSLTYDIVPFSN